MMSTTKKPAMQKSTVHPPAIRLATENDYVPLRSFLKRLYAELGYPRKHLKYVYPDRLNWLFRDNPFRDEARFDLYIAEVEGQIVGEACGLRAELRTNGRSYPCCWFIDYFVLEEHCGFVGIDLMRRLMKENPLVLDFWSAPRASRLFQRLGARQLAKVHAFKKPVSALPPRQNSSSTMSVVRVSSFDSRFDELWSNLEDQFSVSVRRSSRYLNWKFVHQPFSNFQIYLFEINAVCEGYVVTFHYGGFLRGQRFGVVVDILCPPTRPDLFTEMVLFVEQEFKERSVKEIHFALSNQAFCEQLRKMNYSHISTIDVTVKDSDGVLAHVTPDGLGAHSLFGRGDSDFDQFPSGLLSGTFALMNG